MNPNHRLILILSSYIMAVQAYIEAFARLATRVKISMSLFAYAVSLLRNFFHLQVGDGSLA